MREIKIIMIDELKQSLKNKKVIFIIFVYILLLFIGMKKSVTLSMNFSLLLYTVFFTSNKTIPFPLLLFYFVSIVALPLFSLLLTYDIVSEEIHKKTIRFLAQRAKRTYIIIGKCLSAFILNAGVNFVMYLIAIFYIFSKTGELLIVDGILLWVYLTIYSIYFLSLGILISTAISKPQRSLHFGIFLFSAPIIFLFYDKIKWLSPFYYYKDGFYILVNNMPKMIGSVVFLLAFALIFFIAAIIIFRRKDL